MLDIFVSDRVLSIDNDATGQFSQSEGEGRSVGNILTIGPEPESSGIYYVADLWDRYKQQKYCRFRLRMNPMNVNPIIGFVAEENILFVGVENELAAINWNQGLALWTTKVGTVLTALHFVADAVVVFEEGGVRSIRRTDGRELWSHSTDLIKSLRRVDDKLTNLRFFDAPEMTLDLVSGRLAAI